MDITTALPPLSILFFFFNLPAVLLLIHKVVKHSLHKKIMGKKLKSRAFIPVQLNFQPALKPAQYSILDMGASF